MSDSGSKTPDNSESYYAVTVILTVLALYSISVYSHFGGEEVMNQQLYTESLTNSAEITNALTVTGQVEETLFQPINTDNAVYVPGANCTLTGENLTPSGAFYRLSPECGFTTQGD